MQDGNDNDPKSNLRGLEKNDASHFLHRVVLPLGGVSLFISVLVSLAIWKYGSNIAVLFTLFWIASATMWGVTTLHRQIIPLKLLKPFLLSALAWSLHSFELILTGYSEAAYTRLTELHSVNEWNFVLYGLVPLGYALGATLLVFQRPVGYFLAWVAFIVIPASRVPHFIMPYWDVHSGSYFPGLYTAALPILAGLYGIWVTTVEMKKIGGELKLVDTGD